MTAFLNLGLAGYPVSHSLSPVIHRSFMEAAGLKGDYTLFSIPPLEFRRRVTRLAAGGYSGLNITVPHKRAAMELCTSLDPAAERTGAVNTLLFRDGGVMGYNTDVNGFRVFSRGFPTPWVVVGRGGVSGALALAAPQELVLLGRNAPFPEEFLREQEGTLINATPLGWRNDDRFPLEPPEGWTFADLNYNGGWKWRNSLLKRGFRVVTGEVMLVEQAACSFTAWTGYTPSKKTKTDVLNEIRRLTGNE